MAAKKSAKRSASKAAKKATKKAAKKAAAKKAAPKKHKKTAAKKRAAGKAAEEVPVSVAELAAGAAIVAEALAATPPALEEEPPPPEPQPIPKMPARRKDGVITLAHPADTHAAFIVYALSAGKVDTEDRRYELIRSDLQELQHKAERGSYDVTAFSFGAYPKLSSRYMLLPCGGTFGDHRGPILVARRPVRATEVVEGLEVAVPGTDSIAALILKLWYPRGRFRLVPMPAAQVGLMVRANRARAGVLTTEAQLTYRNYNMVAVVDFGRWWGDETEGLPLALTACGIRRDIDEEERAKIALDLKRSIAYALGHREEALAHAATLHPKLAPEIIDKFVERYVNDLSLDCGERGRQAVRLLFDHAHRHGLLPERVVPEYHGV